MTSTLSCTGVSIASLLTATQRTIGDYILVKVSATNSDGTSADSPQSANSVQYASIPVSQVTGLTATTVDSTSVTVAWTDLTLAQSGYNAVTQYTVEYKLSSDTIWNYGGNVTTSPFTVTGLTTLNTYYFRVKATNQYGTGPTTDGTLSASTYGVPSTPGIPTLTQTSGSTSIVATWSAPSSSNGASVTSYSVEILNQDGTTYSILDSHCSEYTTVVPGTTCTVLMTALMTTASYTSANAGTYIKIRVAAVNSFGNSSYSSTNVNSIQVEIAPTANVPTVVLSKTKSSITATWSTSSFTAADYGYAPITYYLYRYKLTSGSWPADWTTATNLSASSTLTATFTSLTAQTSYDF